MGAINKKHRNLLVFSLIVTIVLAGFSINFFLNMEKGIEGDSEIQIKMETIRDISITSTIQVPQTGNLLFAFIYLLQDMNGTKRVLLW